MYKVWGGALVVELLDGCEGGGGLLVFVSMYLCVSVGFWGGGGGGVRKSSLVELVCGKHGNCWSEEGTG